MTIDQLQPQTERRGPEGAMKKLLYIIPVVFVVIVVLELMSNSDAMNEVTPTLYTLRSTAHNEIPLYDTFYTV